MFNFGVKQKYDPITLTDFLFHPFLLSRFWQELFGDIRTLCKIQFFSKKMKLCPNNIRKIPIFTPLLLDQF